MCVLDYYWEGSSAQGGGGGLLLPEHLRDRDRAIHSNTYVFYSKRIAYSCRCDKIHVIEHSAASQTVTNQSIWQHLKSNYPRTHIHLSNYHPLPIVFPPKLADFLFYLFGLPGHSAWKSTFWSRSVSNLIYLSFTYLKYYFKFHVYPSMVRCL